MAEEILVDKAAMQAAADALNAHANNLQTHLDNTQTASVKVVQSFVGNASSAYQNRVKSIQDNINNLRGLATAAQNEVNRHQETTFAVDQRLANAFESGSGVDVTPGG